MINRWHRIVRKSPEKPTPPKKKKKKKKKKNENAIHSWSGSESYLFSDSVEVHELRLLDDLLLYASRLFPPTSSLGSSPSSSSSSSSSSSMSPSSDILSIAKPENDLPGLLPFLTFIGWVGEMFSGAGRASLSFCLSLVSSSSSSSSRNLFLTRARWSDGFWTKSCRRRNDGMKRWLDIYIVYPV